MTAETEQLLLFEQAPSAPLDPPVRFDGWTASDDAPPYALLPGARVLRDVVRLSPPLRPIEDLHIERPPLVNLATGDRLDSTISALCEAELAHVDERHVGLASDATCRRCRHVHRHLSAATRMVYPLWRPGGPR